MGEEACSIFCDYQITAGRDEGIGGESEIDAAGETPSAKSDLGGAPVEKFDILIVVVLGDRVVHDLVENDGVDPQAGVVGLRCARVQGVEIGGTIGITSERNTVSLAAKPDGIDDASLVRIDEEDGFAV